MTPAPIPASRWIKLILPEVFQDRFWDDLAAGFAEFRYLGMAEI